MAGRHARRVDRRARARRPTPSRRTAPRPPRRPPSSARPTPAARPACSPGTWPTNPVNGEPRARSSPPTTCSWATAPARSWPSPAATRATSRSPRRSTCRSSTRSTPPEGTRARRVDAATGAVDQLRRTTSSAWTGWASPTPRRRSSTGSTEQGRRRGHHHLPPARLAVQPPALLGRAVPDRLRRARPAARRPARRCCPWTCPRCRTTRRARSTPDDAHSTPEPPLGRNEDWVNVTLDLGDGPKHVPPGHQHHAQLGRARAGTTCATWTRRTTRRRRRPGARAVLDGPGAQREQSRRRPAASTCTWAASSTPSCTCCTRASGTRSCTTWATSRASSRSGKLFNQGYIQAYAYTDARGVHVPGRRGGRGRRRRRPASPGRASPSTASTGRWASR